MEFTSPSVFPLFGSTESTPPTFCRSSLGSPLICGTKSSTIPGPISSLWPTQPIRSPTRFKASHQTWSNKLDLLSHKTLARYSTPMSSWKSANSQVFFRLKTAHGGAPWTALPCSASIFANFIARLLIKLSAVAQDAAVNSWNFGFWNRAPVPVKKNYDEKWCEIYGRFDWI